MDGQNKSSDVINQLQGPRGGVKTATPEVKHSVKPVDLHTDALLSGFPVHLKRYRNGWCTVSQQKARGSLLDCFFVFFKRSVTWLDRSTRLGLSQDSWTSVRNTWTTLDAAVLADLSSWGQRKRKFFRKISNSDVVRE